MKTRRMMVCASLVVLMLAAWMAAPISARTYIEQGIIPMGVGNAQAAETKAPGTGEENNTYPVATTEVSKNGILSVDIDTLNTGRMKVKIAKDDEVLYYDVDSDRHLDIPLQMGDGGYTVKVFRHIANSDYEAMFATDVEYEAENKNDVFLASSDIVNYGDSKSVGGVTHAVVGGATDPMDIVTLIAGYVIGEFSYDAKKAETLSADYVPNIDTVLSDKGGICYDFAAVTAAMLREAGIPTKLVMGYRSDSNLYHAWNEVLIDGEWVIVDTTWDNVMNNHTMSVQDPELYSAEKVF